MSTTATPLLDQPVKNEIAAAPIALAPAVPAIAIRATDEQIAKIDEISIACGSVLGLQMNEVKRTLMMGSAVKQLKQLLTDDIMKDIMELAGTEIGFLTDLDRGTKQDPNARYSISQVRNCVVSCLIRGGRFTNNEMNIIASKYYATKNFFTRKLQEFEGLTNLKFIIGAPVVKDGRAYVSAEATWDYFGKSDSISFTAKKMEGSEHVVDNRITVRVNEGMGDDGVKGKAEKKLKQAIFTRLTGSKFDDGDGEDNQPRDPTAIEAAHVPAIESKVDPEKPKADETNQEPEFREEFLNEVGEKFKACENYKKVLEYKGQTMKLCQTPIERQSVSDMAAAQLERFKEKK